MNQQLQERCIQYAESFASLSGTSCLVLETMPSELLWLSSEKEHFCQSCTHPNCNKANTHTYGCSEAYRWNGKYIYYCPAGLVFVASSVSEDNGTFAGGLVSGPVVMGNPQDTFSEWVDAGAKEKATALPVFSTKKVKQQSEILAAITAHLSERPHSFLGTFVYEQEKLLNEFYSKKDHWDEDAAGFHYLIEGEKQLHDMILRKDKNSAQILLNDLLGHIYFSNNANLSTIKARIVELVVVLSRAAIEAGADVNEILLSNNEYIEEIESFQTMEEINVWVTGILHRFIQYSFDFAQVKHSDVVYKVMDYVKTNYDKKISLDVIAKNVFLSRSYLSSLFKKETGESLFSYINHIRVEKSKILLFDNTLSLAEITSRCGFEDQSYFTKVFKKETGVSPKKYRESRGRISG